MVKQKREHLEPREIDLLLLAAETQRKRSEVAITLVTLCYHHGLRISEAAMLEWDDIDFEAGAIYVRRVKGSIAGTHEFIEGDRECLATLKAYQQASPREEVRNSKYVFTSERGGCYLKVKKVRTKPSGKNPEGKDSETLTAPGLAVIVKRLGEACGDGIAIKVHAHCLRHSCGTRMAKRGVKGFFIRQWMGHATIQSTQQYVNLAGQKIPEGVF